ncbi:hypothetical protein Leryth_012428 [Lithospermum erythrorhizon]|nr:hypothetical protein Leryth_012428 [Lithospermum erythrorhizon]
MNPIAKVLSIEQSLSELIDTKGLLDEEVQELYHMACAYFENIILDDHQVDKLQEVEYQLWKLHYSHIEEFRKRIWQLTAIAKDKKIKSSQVKSSALVDLEKHIDRFILYLSEATAFYENLMRKLRSQFGLPSNFLSEKTGSSFRIEPTKMNRVHHVCHRFLICIGDIARYKELYRKSDAKNWSAAATCYLEAARVCPDSGNPHNQLALLGTYVDDSFLSLYHCLRSLAVEEPFPDVWRNLMFLIEEKSSCHLHFSSAAYIDFTRPHERISVQPISEVNSDSANKSEATEHGSSRIDMWSLIVRLISFFLVSTSMDNFPHILASTVKELESLESLGETDLQAAMVSYQHITTSKKGPHRGIQLVSMFIFVLNILIENPERERMTNNGQKDQFELARLALATTFICMGRIIEVCLKSKRLQVCPLLPPILTFLEWLVSFLDKVEEHTADDKVNSTMAYFFSVLAELQNQLDHGKKEALTPDTALWEDHELRGFKPMADAHRPLDFRTKHEFMDDFTHEYDDRCLRILNASRKIIMRSKTWQDYDKNKRKYCKVESTSCPGQRETVVLACDSSDGKRVNNPKSGNGEEIKGQITNTTAAAEEEEVILFKPIIRHNSAPLSSSGTSDLINEEKEVTPSEERLRRATSLIDEQNQKQSDSFSFYPDTGYFNHNSNNKLFKQQEHLFKDSTTCAVGPPSLNAWVLNPGSPKIEREKGSRNHNKRELSPIREIASESLAELSINELKDPISGSIHTPASTYNHPSAYVSPVPSAPLLPDDAVWSSGSSSVSQEVNSSVLSQEGDGILGASPLSGYLNYPATSGPSDINPRIPGMLDVQPPMMSSSEWLYHYRNSFNLQRTPHHAFPVSVNSPPFLGAFNPNEASRFGLLDQWGNYLVPDPMVNMETRQVLPTPSSYAPDVQLGNNLFAGYQRSSPPYPLNMGLPLRADQPTLLMQYLKDKEWHSKRESHSGGSPKFYGV